VLQGIVGEVITIKSGRRKAKKIKEIGIPKAASISLYPNPVQANQAFKLSWQGLEPGKYLIKIYNVLGALIHAQDIKIESWMKTFTIDQNLMAGNYFIKLTNKAGRHLSHQLKVY
jgi:hypothetical protein